MKTDLLDLELQGIAAELDSLNTFTGVIEDRIRDATDRERTVDFANIILSCLSMQTAKIKEIIATTDKLDDAVRKTQSTD